MTNAVEVAGDVAAVSSAVAGLTLVFVGAISASYDSYEKSEQSSIRSRYQRRAWFAFAGLALAILSTAMDYSIYNAPLWPLSQVYLSL
jgi:hypothetical protein